MTTKTYAKVIKQIGHKKAKMTKLMKHNKPKERKQGRGRHRCIVCLQRNAHISRYGIHMCRLCFREKANELGFRKLRWKK